MMAIPILLLFLVVVGLPVAWLVAEFRCNRPARVALGVLAILSCFAVATIVGKLSELDYNAWYGGATKELIETTVAQIEDGQIDRVMAVLRALNRQYQPTYENRANYRSLVEDATARMRGDVEIAEGFPWDATVFDGSTWHGHWESDTGFWIVIDDVGRNFDIVRSGYPDVKLESISVSDAYRVLVFQEGSKWRHTLTLLNKYESKHEWFDLEGQTVWQTNRLHKLIRPAPEQRSMTQQAEK